MVIYNRAGSLPESMNEGGREGEMSGGREGVERREEGRGGVRIRDAYRSVLKSLNGNGVPVLSYCWIKSHLVSYGEEEILLIGLICPVLLYTKY